MPYIKQVDRPRYNGIIMDMVRLMNNGPEAQLTKGEYFGMFVNRVCLAYMGSVDYTQPAFNSSLFTDAARKVINTSADKVVSFLSGNNILATAGELNYVISAILWGVLGSAEGIESAGYGYRSYVKSMVEQVRDRIKIAKFEKLDQRDSLMVSRKYSVVSSVLNDVVAEVNRRGTATYEDGKITENGDVWVEGKLLG